MEQQTVYETSSSAAIEELLKVSHVTAQDLVNWQKLASTQAQQRLEGRIDANEVDELARLMQWEFEHAAQLCDDRTLDTLKNNGGKQSLFLLRNAQHQHRPNEQFVIDTDASGKFIRGECMLLPQDEGQVPTRIVVDGSEVAYQRQLYRYLGEDMTEYTWEQADPRTARTIHERFSTAVTDALIMRIERGESENIEADRAAFQLQIKLGSYAMLAS